MSDVLRFLICSYQNIVDAEMGMLRIGPDCVQIECYQEVPFSSPQTTCEVERSKDWDITCYGFKKYTSLAKAIHCGKLWCSDGFEDASKEKGPYSKWYPPYFLGKLHAGRPCNDVHTCGHCCVRGRRLVQRK